MDLKLVTLSGPRGKLGDVLSALDDAGMPAAQQDVRFHAVATPKGRRKKDDPEPITQPITTDGGDPVWEDKPSELTVQVLTDDLESLERLIGTWRIRMIEPSGFASLDEAYAIAAGLHQPSTTKDELLSALRDPEFASIVRDLLGSKS